MENISGLCLTKMNLDFGKYIILICFVMWELNTYTWKILSEPEIKNDYVAS